MVHCCAARQHKSQFEQLIEAARKNRSGLAGRGNVKDIEKTKQDIDRSSASSVELVTDSEMQSTDAACFIAITDDNQNVLYTGSLLKHIINAHDRFLFHIMQNSHCIIMQSCKFSSNV